MIDTDTPSIPAGPLFSVVIATYNYGHLVERAITSVLGQTYKDFELIVVDDGSTDDTPARLSAYGDRIRYVRKENGGQSSAYNLGADLAAGKYIYILDADDELLPDALEKFASAIAGSSSEGTGIYYGGYVSVSENGAERVRNPAPSPANARDRLKLFLRRRITGLQNCTGVVPKSLFQRFRYPENVRNNTDIVFIGQIVANFQATPIDAIVARIHEHPQRTRKQLDRILAAGTAPVDALFEPEAIPTELMDLKRLYLGQRLRSIARQCFLHGDFRNARKHYLGALGAYPSVMLDVGSIKRMIVSLIRGTTA